MTEQEARKAVENFIWEDDDTGEKTKFSIVECISSDPDEYIFHCVENGRIPEDEDDVIPIGVYGPDEVFILPT